MRNTVLAISLIMTACIGSGCSDEDPDRAVELKFRSKDIADGELAINKGDGVLVGVTSADENGEEFDIFEDITWETSDPDMLYVEGLGSTALCEGLKDWFDTLPEEDDGDAGADAGIDDAGAEVDAGEAELPEPHEPRAVLTVRYGNVKASIDVAVVIDAAGKWTIYIEDKEKPLVELDLRQSGRHVTSDMADYTGRIEGNAILLSVDKYELEGIFIDPDNIAGTLGGSDTWRAERE